TRFSRDWSSDVCSSDLGNSLGVQPAVLGIGELVRVVPGQALWRRRRLRDRHGGRGRQIPVGESAHARGVLHALVMAGRRRLLSLRYRAVAEQVVRPGRTHGPAGTTLAQSDRPVQAIVGIRQRLVSGVGGRHHVTRGVVHRGAVALVEGRLEYSGYQTCAQAGRTIIIYPASIANASRTVTRPCALPSESSRFFASRGGKSLTGRNKATTRTHRFKQTPTAMHNPTKSYI